jgi:hypothetical protein
MRGENLSTLGESTLGRTSVQESDAPEARRVEVDSGHHIKGETRVKRSCTSGGSQCESLKLPKLEEPKAIVVVDPWEDTCQQIVDFE